MQRAKSGLRAGAGRQRAHPARQGFGGFAEIQLRIGGADFRRERGGGVILLRPVDAPRGDGVHGAGGGFGGERRQPRAQAGGVIALGNGRAEARAPIAFCEHERPRIHFARHAHDGNSGLGISRQNGVGNGCCAALARQQTGVGVDAVAAGRQLAQRLWQKLPEGHHHPQIRAKRRQRFQVFCAARALGLQQRDAGFGSQRGHGQRRAAAAAAARPLGLRHHGHHRMRAAQQPGQSGRGKAGRAEKGEPQPPRAQSAAPGRPAVAGAANFSAFLRRRT